MPEIRTFLTPADLAALVALFVTFYFYPVLSGRFMGEDIGARMKAWRHEWTRQMALSEENRLRREGRSCSPAA